MSSQLAAIPLHGGTFHITNPKSRIHIRKQFQDLVNIAKGHLTVV